MEERLCFRVLRHSLGRRGKKELHAVVEFEGVDVAPEETLALYAFMEAADESKRQGGKEVPLVDVMEQAKKQAVERVKALGIEGSR